MTTTNLLPVLTATGLTIELEDDSLLVGPKTLLSDAVRRIITAHKPDLIDALRQPEPSIDLAGLDPEIVSTIARRNTPDQMLRHLHSCLDRYANTSDPLWIEAASWWAAALRCTPTLEQPVPRVPISDADFEAALEAMLREEAA